MSPPKETPPRLELARTPGTKPAEEAGREVRSAARAQPLPAAPPRRQATNERLKEGATDTLLNSISILGEIAEDFRNSDRYFKYKALVLTLWFALTVGAFGVACPDQGPTNDISAQLVIGGDAANPFYMLKNDGALPWQDVEITVNGLYRSTLSVIDPNGGSITLSSAVLFDAQGRRAPAGLRILDIRIRVRDPDADLTVFEDGRPR